MVMNKPQTRRQTHKNASFIYLHLDILTENVYNKSAIGVILITEVYKHESN